MIKNWKTNLTALIIAITGVAVSLGYITTEVGLAIGTLITAIGFKVAQDA